MSDPFHWYTGFEDFVADGIAEACHWIKYKKVINQVGLDDDALEEGMELLRTFVNDRASLYRYRDAIAELILEKAKAELAGDQVEVVKVIARGRKVKEKAILKVFKILDHRNEFDDWLALEGVDEIQRGKAKANEVDYDF